MTTKVKLPLLVSLLGWIVPPGTIHAGTVSVVRTVTGNAGLFDASGDPIAAGPVGANSVAGAGWNEGGVFDLNNVVLLDDRVGGRFLVTIDDSDDTGAVFTAIVSVSGKWTAEEAEGIRTSNGGNGRLFFRDDSLTREITFTVTDITETTTTGASINFDGFESFSIQSWNAGDFLEIDGNSYEGDNSSTIMLTSLAPSGTTADHSGGDTAIDGFTTKWTISGGGGGGDKIDITRITKTGISVGVDFTSESGAVDVYKSLDLSSLGSTLIMEDVTPGTGVVIDDAASEPKSFYLLVPANSPAP